MRPVAIEDLYPQDDEHDEHDEHGNGGNGGNGDNGDKARSGRHYTKAEEAVAEVGRVIEMMDRLRGDVASIYFFAAGGTVVEHELGEALQAIRKSLVRLRKARAEISQMDQLELPLE
jgi:hypothetical protein